MTAGSGCNDDRAAAQAFAAGELDHFVTQWMSTVGVSSGMARNSFHVQVRAASTAPSIVNVH